MDPIKSLHYHLDRLVSQWDRKQSTRKGYNPNALAIYLGRVADVVEHVKSGVPVVEAIDREFNDRLRDFLVKNLGR